MTDLFCRITTRGWKCCCTQAHTQTPFLAPCRKTTPIHSLVHLTCRKNFHSVAHPSSAEVCTAALIPMTRLSLQPYAPLPKSTHPASSLREYLDALPKMTACNSKLHSACFAGTLGSDSSVLASGFGDPSWPCGGGARAAGVPGVAFRGLLRPGPSEAKIARVV